MDHQTCSEEQQAIAARYEQARAEIADSKQPTPMMSGFPPKPCQRVTWDNWMRPPFSRWGFRHLNQLRPSIEVPAGRGPVRELPEAPQDLDNLCFESVCGQQISVVEALQATQADSLLVLHRGKVVYERYLAGQRATDRHVMFSVTKSLIGILAEQLISEGVLDCALRTDHYLPELAGSAFGDASVRQLMDMAVGIEFSEEYDDPRSESSQYGYACGFQPAPAEFARYASLYEYLPTLRKKGEHGGHFHYVTACTEVLAWVMERASSTACADLLTRIWSRMGAESSGYFMADPWGRSVCGAGFNATARDMARFGLLLAENGCCRGEQLIDVDTIERIAQGSDPAIYAQDEDFHAWVPGASYKSQWYVTNDDSQSMMAGGIHGQYLFIDRPSQVVIVKQSTLPEAVGLLDPDSVRLLKAITAHLKK